MARRYGQVAEAAPDLEAELQAAITAKDWPRATELTTKLGRAVRVACWIAELVFKAEAAFQGIWEAAFIFAPSNGNSSSQRGDRTDLGGHKPRPGSCEIL